MPENEDRSRRTKEEREEKKANGHDKSTAEEKEQSKSGYRPR